MNGNFRGCLQMKYNVEITKKALKQLKKIQQQQQIKIF